MTTILDGKKVRDAAAEKIVARIALLPDKPKLLIVQVGNDERSSAYIRQKKTFGAKLGCDVELAQFPESAAEAELVAAIGKANTDPKTHGVIVQLPLPAHIGVHAVIEAIDPRKDVDGLTSFNMKMLIEGSGEGLVPATAKGVLAILDYYGIGVSGKRAVVVGRSMLVGKPTALLLLARNATVTVCHSKTIDLAAETRHAEILVVAAGKPGLIGSDHVSPGQTVIDVGITAVERNGVRSLVGDVEYDAVKDVVGALSPVPGGVGPMTVLSLFENLVDASERQQGRN